MYRSAIKKQRVDIDFAKIFARKTGVKEGEGDAMNERREPRGISDGVNKGQPRAIINTCLPTSAREWGQARSSLGSSGFD